MRKRRTYKPRVRRTPDGRTFVNGVEYVRTSSPPRVERTPDGRLLVNGVEYVRPGELSPPPSAQVHGVTEADLEARGQ